MPSPRRVAAKLAAMPLGEIAGRALQYGRRLGDRFFLPTAYARAMARSSRPTLTVRAPVSALSSPGAAAQYVRAHHPDHAARLISAADEVVHGRYSLLGLPALALGEIPDWLTEPIAEKRAPRILAHRIPYLDPSVVGDSKVLWELNRHQFLITLGQAYRLTGDARYADRVWDLVRSWIDQNPVGVGINWASSLELSLRAIAWCWAWHLADGATFLDPLTRRRFITVLEFHGRQIERYLSYYFSPNTHLTGEALGLCYLATSWPGLRRSAQWWEQGAQILHDEARRQFFADGLHFERSACYHLYSLEFYLHYRLLCETRGVPLGEETLTGLEAMAEAAQVLERPDGLLPALGDDDGGKLMFLGAEASMDPAVALATASILFNRASWWPEGAARAGAVWLVGPTRFAGAPKRQREARTNTARALHVFPSAGVAVSRSGQGDRLYVSAGVQAPPPLCLGHVHDDALALEIWCEGRPVLLDPGTFTYTGDAAQRNRYRSAAAHTGATVDGFPATPTSDPFRWDGLRGGRLVRAAGDADCHVLELERRIEVGARSVMHHRRIVALPDTGWLIWDRFRGNGTHDVRIHFQLAPEMDDPHAPARLSWGTATPPLMVVTPPDEDWRQRTVPSPVSPVYGASCRAIALECAGQIAFPTDVLSIVLRPDQRVDALRAARVTRRALATALGSVTCCAVELRAPDDTVRHRIVLREEPTTPLTVDTPPGAFTTIWLTTGSGCTDGPDSTDGCTPVRGMHDVACGVHGLFAALTPAGCGD